MGMGSLFKGKAKDIDLPAEKGRDPRLPPDSKGTFGRIKAGVNILKSKGMIGGRSTGGKR